MQKNTTIIIAAAMLIIGLCIGYQTGGNRNSPGVHMMPNGEMMKHNSMGMEDMMTSMNAALKGKSGDAFDKAFLAEMIVHHQGAVEMAELALTNAKHQEIKDMAKAIISAQNKEIADMKGWQKGWYNQ